MLTLVKKPFSWMWDKLRKFFRDSETLVWAFVQGATGSVGSAALYFWNDPALRNALQAMVKIEYVPIYLIVMGVITLVARLHRAKDL